MGQLQLLRAHHPAAAALLSQLGRRISYPRGVPAQAADARHTRINATIGQVTDGAGGALSMPLVRELLGPLEPDDVVLYAAQGGEPLLRTVWSQWQARDPRVARTARSLPVVTQGLTHALSIVADLFIDTETRVLVPDPCWGNYRGGLGLRRGARIDTYPLLQGDRLAVDEIARTLASESRPTVMVVNMPGNPVGFTPTQTDAEALAEVLRSAPGPLVVVCDDAYLGMGWEPGLLEGSFFGLLEGADPERLLAVKVDGATKELFLFGARVGFLTFQAEPEVAAVLEDKVKAVARAAVSSMSRVGQELVLQTLRHPQLGVQRDVICRVLAGRYRALRVAIDAHELEAFPYNSGFFVLVKVPEPEAVRRRLLERGVGVVAFPEVGAVRLSYGSVDEADISELVGELADAIAYAASAASALDTVALSS